MTLTVQLPLSVEQQLRRRTSDLPVEAKQAMLIEFYRQDKLTRYQLSEALGLSRFETDALLKKHNVTEDLPTSTELEEDFQQGLRLVNP
ncbi:MAG: UPF0175 family protein [Phycisphaerales bacterium]|nr:UPF0175 family protein [Phycisphaerales bacterium]